LISSVINQEIRADDMISEIILVTLCIPLIAILAGFIARWRKW
jgi:hypothetical protein